MSGWGPRAGWLGGVIGGTLWMPITALVLMIHGQPFWGTVLLVLAATTLVLGVALRPWRRPDVALWKLFLAMICPVLAGAALALWRLAVQSDFNTLLLLPSLVVFLIPCLTLGRRTWRDIHEPCVVEEKGNQDDSPR